MGAISSKNKTNMVKPLNTENANILQTRTLSNIPSVNNSNMDSNYSYIIEKNKNNHKEIEGRLSFLIILSIIILIILLFFISYKFFIFMTINNVDIGIFPYANNVDSDGYDINYLSEQIYYKTLSDTDKDTYLTLQDFEKDNAIKKYFVSQILV